MLDYTAFYKKQTSPDGYCSMCRECSQAYWAANKGANYRLLSESRKDKSLAVMYPEVAAQFDLEKNPFGPDQISYSSAFKAWWNCPNGHSYQSVIHSRTSGGAGCRQCRYTVAFEDSFEAVHADFVDWLADPEDRKRSAKSRTKTNFTCPNGHNFTILMNSFRGKCQTCDTANKSIAMHDNGRYIAEWDNDKNNLSPYEVSYNSAKKVWWRCPTCSHSWETCAYQRVNSETGCPKCVNARLVSVQEEELRSLILELIDGKYEVVFNDRNVLEGKELDIYIPDIKVAVEFNGTYWHTEEHGRDRHYHHDKWLACKEHGIQLVTIWDDEWAAKPQIVRAMLTAKLGVYRGPKVFARKTTVKSINYAEAAEFLDQHHIQGEMRASYYFALMHPETDEMVAVSLWSKRGSDLYLDRYATSMMVVGGMGKLLSYAKVNASEGVSRIITFANHEVSDGGLYQKLGFELEKELKPDYTYLYKQQRFHKFNFRLKRFRTDGELLYEEGLSESELAKLNKIDRIWDAGKDRYVLALDS